MASGIFHFHISQPGFQMTCRFLSGWILRLIGVVALSPCCPFFLYGQVNDPYVLNGEASQNDCNCYTLTRNENFVSGSVWNKNKISLDQPFNYYFNIYLGCDAHGADGIAFILQPISTSLGAVGEGLGFQGISPSVGVTIDTYQNFNDNDPSYDHIAIQTNGVIKHDTSTDLTGPVQALVNSPNIKDCRWHVLQVNWDPVKHLLQGSIDGVLRVSATVDLVNSIFKGDPMVFWGFTASTGGSKNLQQFCTALNAKFNYGPVDKQCLGTPVVFTDSSKSFGTITAWNWNFGDGGSDNIPNPPPHNYAQPGHYTVKLTVTGNTGCMDTVSTPVTIGSIPVADFKDDTSCNGRPLQLLDASTNQVGQINQWYWDFGNGQGSGLQNPVMNFQQPGKYPVKLAVATENGCISDTVRHDIVVQSTPLISMQFNNVCLSQPAFFTGNNLQPLSPIRAWHWDLGDGTAGNTDILQHVYLNPGVFPVRLYATGTDGCLSDTLSDSIHIIQINANAGNDTIVARGQPLQLNASGGSLFSWSPPDGLSDPAIANPVAVLQKDMTYYLTVSSPEGCAGRDTLNIKVYEGPQFYVPTAFSPNGDGQNDIFRPVAAGMKRLNYFRVFDRWGRQMFSTRTLMEGWDGKYAGQDAPLGAYVWMIEGTDYKGKVIFRKGTVTLIR